jgi:hypothetical protein
MTITIDPRALTATVLILLALYLFVRRDGLRLMIITVMMFFVSYFNLARDLPREAVISAMDVFLVFLAGAAVVVLYSVYRFTIKHKEEERMK